MGTVSSISLVGLGKLGLNLAACIAECGIKVIGVDKFPEVTNSINSCRPPIYEPGLEELLKRVVGKTLEATTDIQRCVSETDITFILVQTPSLPDGSYGTGALESVLKPLCAEIKARSKIGHTIVICSTIQPGTIRGQLAPMIEELSGMRIGHGIHLAYNPELVALGTAIKNFQEPDFVLIGADNPHVAEKIVAVQKRLTRNDPPVHVMSTASAEIVKIALNAYLTVKISYANLISQLASKVEGAEIDKINGAIGADKRIGAKFFKAGPSFGGTCFPRDVKAFIRFCEASGLSSNLPLAVDQINRDQDDMLEACALAALERAQSNSISILGMAFKSGTPIIAESAGVKLASRLAARGIEVCYFDPHAAASIKAEFNTDFREASSIEEAFLLSPVVALHHADKAFLDALKNTAHPPKVVIDCWGALNGTELSEGVESLRLGEFTGGGGTGEAIKVHARSH